MNYRHFILIITLLMTQRVMANTYFLVNTASSATTNPGQSMQTANTGASGFTPTLVTSSTPVYFYSASVTGAYSAGTWQFVMWSSSPGCSAPVYVEIGYSNPDGSGYVKLSSDTVDVNASGAGNHTTAFTFPGIPFLNLSGKVLRLEIQQNSGCDTTMAYNGGVDFDTRLITTALGPSGTATISPTSSPSPTATATFAPALVKSVNLTSASIGDTLTYTLTYRNPNATSGTSCQDTFESGATLWPSGWTSPTGGTWNIVSNNGPTLAGSSALDAQAVGGYNFTTINCAGQVTDGSIQADVYDMTSNGELDLLWRQNGSSTYQISIIQGSAANVSLRVITNGAFNELSAVSYPINIDQWYTLKLVVQGFTLQGYINGVLVLSATDPNASYNSGAAGIEIDDAASTGMQAEFDNVIINDYPVSWYNVNIVDTLPAGLTYVSNSCGATESGGIVTYNAGTLTAGSMTSCNIIAVINTCPTTLINQAQIQVGLPAQEYTSNDVTTTVSCFSPTKTITPTSTSTLTRTPTLTSTSSGTPSKTATASPTFSPTTTPTPSSTPTATQSFSPTLSPSPTFSSTVTPTPSSTPTATQSFSPTLSPSPTATETATPSNSQTMTPTLSDTITSTRTPTSSPTVTLSYSPTSTPTVTLTFSMTDTITVGPSPSPSWTVTDSPSPTSSPTFTSTSTSTSTASPSQTPTPSPTRSATVTSTLTSTPPNTSTPTSTISPTASPTQTSTITMTFTPTATLSGTRTTSPTWTSTATQSSSPTATSSPTITATSTRSPTPTSSFTASPSPIAMPMKLTVTIYNSAGEIVNHLYDGNSQNFSGGFSTNTTAFVQGSNGVTLTLGGLTQNGSDTLTWTGLNDGNQPVAGGIYTIQVLETDSFGSTHSWTQPISVLPEQQTQLLNIYNSAGELVTSINTSPYSSQPLMSLGFVNGNSSAFVLGNGNDIKFLMTNTNGSQVVLPWDGKSSAGQTVASGSYIAQLIDIGSSQTVMMSKGFVVLTSPSQSWSVVVAPNPIRAQDKTMVLSLSGFPIGFVPRAMVYTMSGELIGRGQGVPGGNSIVMPVESWPAGIYIVVVEATEGSATLSRQICRLAAIR